MVPESPIARGKTRNESPQSSRSLPPVTPGVNKDGTSAYTEAKEVEQPTEDAESYFNEAQKASPDSPTQAAAGARTSEELLRRLSLPPGGAIVREVKSYNPRSRYSSLNLSGRIISATFVLPFSLKLSEGGNWVCHFYALHAMSDKSR
jgi:trehalose 6-phosphate synthase/phosphatase